MTQRARLLALLRDRGPAGVSPADFLLPDVADGGPPITRLAARALELRAAGFDVASVTDGGAFTRYVLTSEGGADAAEAYTAGPGAIHAPVPAAGVSLAGEGRLFDPPHQPASAYDEGRAA